MARYALLGRRGDWVDCMTCGCVNIKEKERDASGLMQKASRHTQQAKFTGADASVNKSVNSLRREARGLNDPERVETTQRDGDTSRSGESGFLGSDWCTTENPQERTSAHPFEFLEESFSDSVKVFHGLFLGSDLATIENHRSASPGLEPGRVAKDLLTSTSVATAVGELSDTTTRDAQRVDLKGMNSDECAAEDRVQEDALAYDQQSPAQNSAPPFHAQDAKSETKAEGSPRQLASPRSFFSSFKRSPSMDGSTSSTASSSLLSPRKSIQSFKHRFSFHSKQDSTKEKTAPPPQRARYDFEETGQFFESLGTGDEAIVIYDYIGEPGAPFPPDPRREITIDKGRTLDILDMREDGWCLVRKPKDSREYWMPGNYLSVDAGKTPYFSLGALP